MDIGVGGSTTSNKYEVTRVIQWRVDELRRGKPALLATTSEDDFITVALREFRAGLLRYEMRRRYPDGTCKEEVVEAAAIPQ